MQAALGLGQVRRQDEIRMEREAIAARYNDLIAVVECRIQEYEIARVSTELVSLPDGLAERLDVE